jgi:DNA-binding SARP family transcriptional activator
VEFGILGPLAVWEDGRELPLGPPRQRAVLAVLLLRRGEVVPTATIVDLLWGERPPATATKTVQVYVSQLRKALGAGAVETAPLGYSLGAATGVLDLDRFDELLGRGRRLLREGKAEEAEDVLRQALTLWRGPPLADFRYDAFARDEIARLHELRMVAVELRLEAELASGGHTEAVPELETLVREHPLRESLRGLLMLALYRAGRQADALATYQEARTAATNAKARASRLTRPARPCAELGPEAADVRHASARSSWRQERWRSRLCSPWDTRDLP